MSGIEIAGLVLGVVPNVISAIEHYESAFEAFKELSAPIDEHGIAVTFLLNTTFRDALFVMNQVERYVLHADDQLVVAFIKTYTSSFNMIGVAGAIIAQVAISAISLTGLENSHWTAEAFFVLSLVTGCLSVFFSCAISPAFHGLHSAEAIKDFLCKPIPRENTGVLKEILRKTKRLEENEMTQYKNFVEQGRWRVPSAYAAILLVVPMTLLNVALNTFLIGLGIYLGELYTSRLVPSYGDGTIGILVFYLVSTLFGIGMYYIPLSLKKLEDAPLELWRRNFEEHNNRAKGQGVRNESTNTNHEQSRSTPTAAGFRQSMHERSGTRVHYSVKDGILHEEMQTNDRPSSRRSEAHPTQESVPDSRAQHTASNPAYPIDTRFHPRPDWNNLQQILKDLVQTQEENLRINRRLLDAFQAERLAA